MTHPREQHRIVSDRSENSEREEVLFTSMKNNTNQTSNHNPNNIISDILIRHQAKGKIEKLEKSKASFLLKEKHSIYRIYTTA